MREVGGGGIFAGHYDICLPSHCVLSLHPLTPPSFPQTHPYPQCSNITWYNHRVPLWDRQCVTSVIQYATDIEKALPEAATSEERYYQLLVWKHQISKKLEESRKIKMS